MNVNSPLRRRRQSIRPQHRRDIGAGSPASTKSPAVSGILKETLMAQLNARVDADRSNPFEFARNGSTTTHNQPIARFDGQHKRIFKSMAPIAPVDKRRQCPQTTKPARPLMSPAAQRLTSDSTPKSLKRIELFSHPAATPSKRRKVDEPAGESKGAMAYTGRPSIEAATNAAQDSRISQDNTRPKPPAKRQRPSGSTCSGGASMKIHENSAVNAKSCLPATQQADNAEVETSLRTPPNQVAKASLREQKRLDQRKKTTVQRKKIKTGPLRPGWK